MAQQKKPTACNVVQPGQPRGVRPAAKHDTSMNIDTHGSLQSRVDRMKAANRNYGGGRGGAA